jgi:hypothetical protein
MKMTALFLATVLAPLTTFALDSGPTAEVPPPAATASPAVPATVPPPAVVTPAEPPAALQAPPPVAPVPLAPVERSGLYAGFSFGTGTGSVYSGSQTTSVSDLVPGMSPMTYALMLRGGWSNGDYLYGMQLNLIRSEWSSGGTTASMQLTGVDLVVTWMPRDLGIFVRGGVGPANLSFDGSSGFVSDSYGGAEFMLGIGLGSGGFGVAIDYVRQVYDKGAPIDGAGYLLATLSLDLG